MLLARLADCSLILFKGVGVSSPSSSSYCFAKKRARNFESRDFVLILLTKEATSSKSRFLSWFSSSTFSISASLASSTLCTSRASEIRGLWGLTLSYIPISSMDGCLEIRLRAGNISTWRSSRATSLILENSSSSMKSYSPKLLIEIYWSIMEPSRVFIEWGLYFNILGVYGLELIFCMELWWILIVISLWVANSLVPPT